MVLVAGSLLVSLADDAPSVVEAACYALGELGGSPAGDGAEAVRDHRDGEGVRDHRDGEGVRDRRDGEGPGEAREPLRADHLKAAVAALARTATAHPEPLCREAAVAALGAIGSPDGLGAVLAALEDKPAIRRRAVVALAAFESAEVLTALARAADDPDWQVRQVAEDLIGKRPRPA
jgi:HEAT repeat protein